MAGVSRKRAILLRCGLVLFGSVIALGLAELLLRLLGVSYPRPYLPDDYTGSRLQPGWSGVFTKEGRAFASTNSAGFRDREHTPSKPENTFRILVLGDSYVEAVQLPQEETFWSVLEQQLQADFRHAGKQVEVIAMGISGWGTAQQSLALEHYGFIYDPDLVVLAFFGANDLINNSRELQREGSRPYYVLEGDGLRLDESFHSDPVFLKAKSRLTALKVGLANYSRMLQLIQEIRHRRMASRKALAAAGLDERCFREPEDATWKSAWTVTEKIIERMNTLCQKHGAMFCVATVNSPIQVHPDPAQREAFCKRIGVAGLNYADDRIEQLGKRLGIPVVVLSEPLRTYAEAHREYLHGFANTALGEGHWNATGHRKVGEILADRLRRELFNTDGSFR